MLKSKGLILFGLMLLLFYSCKNDLALNAPYKEIPTIYAVLSPQEKIHMIRVNKVFLGEGDANLMAKVADSVNYPPGELSVTLDRFQYGSQVHASPGSLSVQFRDSVITTVEGAFSRTQRVYVSSEQLFTSGDYQLTVKNTKTGNIFKARAAAFDSVNGNQGFKPLTLVPLYPYPPGTNPDEYVDYKTYSVSVRYTPNDAAVYQLRIRVHYEEDRGILDTLQDYVDYDFATQGLKDVRIINQFNKFLVNEASSEAFFSGIGVALNKKNLSDKLLGRKLIRIEFIIYSSTREMVDYLQFVAPSFGISADKPLYSNFENKSAIGLFTFRARCSVSKEMSTFFINEFSRNKNTCKYRFYDSDGIVLGCN